MGISLQQWKIRVGTFVQHGPKQKFRPAMLTLGQKVFTVPLQLTLVMSLLLLLSGDIESNPGPVDTRQSKQKAKYVYANPGEIKDLKSSVEYFNKQFKNMETKINDLESELNTLYQENEKLSKKCQQLEDQSRRDNLIFYGIEEGVGKETWNDCERKVRKVLKEKVGIEDAENDLVISIERAHRLSSKKVSSRDRPSQARPVIVKFSSWKTKEEICFKARKAFKDKVYRDAGYGVSEDFSVQVREARAKLVPFLLEKRRELPDKPVYLKYDKLVVDKKHYRYLSETETIAEIKHE